MASGDNSDTNNGGGKSPKLDKDVQRKLKERKEEMLLLDRFKKVASAKLEAMTRQSEESGIKYQMGDKEKQIFRQMSGMGIKEGLAAGVVTFFVLRRGPIYIARWVYKRRLAQQQQQHQHHQQPQQHSSMSQPPPGDGSYRLSDPNAPQNPFQVAQRQDFPRSRNVFIRSIWFAFDSVLSLMMAASVSMAFTDTDKLREQLIDLPLVEGRSLTADALCDDIVKELSKVKQENNPAYQRLAKLNQQVEKTPASFYLQGIIAFSDNCERRRFEEQRLRQEQGLPEGEPVEIPRPISAKAPRLVLFEDGDDSGKVELQGTTSTFSDDDFEDLDWDDASDFTDDNDNDDDDQQETSNPGSRKK